MNKKKRRVGNEISESLGSVHCSGTKDNIERVRAREFGDALFSPLTSRAVSDKAHRLTEELARQILEHEMTSGLRKNRRGTTGINVNNAVVGFVADLLRASASDTAHGYVYRAMRPKGFTGQKVSYRVFKRVVDSMSALGLVEIYGGFQTWGEGFNGKATQGWGKATCFRASRRLLDISAQHGVFPSDVDADFTVPLPENPLVLRASPTKSATGQKISGKLMKFAETNATLAVSEGVRRLNTFLDGFELKGSMHRGYIRVFNNGDDPAFNWNMGGRLYSHGEGNYQQMPKEERLRMFLNNEPVCEIDIRASYLTILHAWANEPFDARKDPYDIPGLGPEFRDLAKAWIVASFGNNALITKWTRDLREDFLERTGRNIPKRLSASEVGSKIVARHPVLARLGKHIGGKKVGWAELMYAESRAMFSTMLELMRLGIPSLSMHDSIIVSVQKHHAASRALRKNYKAVTNADPVLVSYAPRGHRILLPNGHTGYDLIDETTR